MTVYPIDQIIADLKQAIRDHSSLVLQAPPGAGKTTRVPIALLDVIPADSGGIIMLEPRRIAAVSAARWMASSLNEQPGETIGYAIRFDARRSAKTRIEVVTEGILTRRLQSDPGLTGISLIIFDEYHERSIHADLALALCLDARKILRPDLKILVMSATLNTGRIASLLGNAPVITSTGKTFSVTETYGIDSTSPLPERIRAAVITALRESLGDILVFLPGSAEIRACAALLRTALAGREKQVVIRPLYGDMPFEEQEQAIMPSPDQRKIVLATNIAETSLTIDGVRVVIDSGLTRVLRYDPATGMNRLATVPVSRASADQRKGRAGRQGPGSCYRLYSSHSFQGMTPFNQPEILVSELSQFTLELALWGVKDPSELAWLDPPPGSSLDAAVTLLRDLGAIAIDGTITTTGRAMARLPLHPRLSRLLLRSQELGHLELGADLAALLTERDFFRHATGDAFAGEPDISERLDMLHLGRRGGLTGANIDPSAIRAVQRTSQQLRRLVASVAASSYPGAPSQELVSRLLLAAFPDRICKRREEGAGRFIHSQGRGVRISRNSFLGSSPFIIAVAVDAGAKTEGFVHLAAPVTEELIRSECGSRITFARNIEWDWKERRIIAAENELLDMLTLSHRPFLPSSGETAPILCNAVRSSPELLKLTREVRQYQCRVALIRRAFPEEAWPDFSDARLFSHPEDWLSDWLEEVRTGQDLAGINILAALKAKLSRDQLRLIEERAPLTITVPSGSRITLDYAAGDQPMLAVKLQEMFGLGDTPAVAAGRVKVLLHLLSPAKRPIQITQDLRGFWNNGYALVRKELKGRYPKHPWPDDPWNALPTRRAKARGT